MENSSELIDTPFPALSMYLGLLASKGATVGNLIRRKTFLTMLLRELEKFPATEKVYGALVEEKLKSFGQEELRHFFQVTAREFYWFWTDDKEKVSAYRSGSEQIAVNPFRIHLVNTLNELQKMADEHFDTKPHESLTAYYDALGKNDKKASVRLPLARVLLYVFRNFDQQSDMFRAAVTAISEKYESTVGREGFLFIAREFYPIWAKYESK